MSGELLAELRKDINMTQQDLADYLRVSKDSISKYERMEVAPPDDIKIRLAQLFNVSIDYLMGLSRVASYDEYIPFPNNTPMEIREKTIKYMEKLMDEYEMQER